MNTMMKSVCLLLLSVMLCPAAFSQMQEEKRSVSDYNRISYSLSGNLIIVPGNSEGLVIKGSKEDIANIETEVSNGNLKIHKRKNINRIGDIKVIVNVKQLEELSIAGSGDVLIKSGLSEESFEINISGSGDVKCHAMKAERTELNIAGSGDILMHDGGTQDLEISIAGSGDVNTADFKASDVEISIAGSGDATVWAEENLETSIVGSGDVKYKGNPKVNASTVGSGTTRSM